MQGLSTLAIAHLLLRLQPINRALRAAVEWQTRAAARLARPNVSALCLTEEHVKTLLEDLDVLQTGCVLPGVPAALSAEEQETEDELRLQCAALNATLPFDRLTGNLGLSAFEQEAVLLCAAPELDRSYERICAYILDDLNRRFPCVELLCSLTAVSLEERLLRRHCLSRFGRLRRIGLLRPHGTAPTELRQELCLAPGLFDFLLGESADIAAMFRDPDAVALPPTSRLPAQLDPEHLARLSRDLAERHLSVLCVWGPRQSGPEEVVFALTLDAGRPLRRLPLLEMERPGTDPELILREAFLTAAGLGAFLWVETDSLEDRGRLPLILAEGLAHSPVPVLLTGVYPWRPARLLEASTYFEVELPAPVFPDRESMWSKSFPELEKQRIDLLAARFSLSDAEIRAVSRVARARACLAGNGQPAPVSEHVEAACAVVTQRRSSQFATVIKPQRGPADLILPAALHQQVIEVASFFRAWPRVDEEWGFRRLAPGGGIKALFTGDPGTGKTLAAEVIAHLLGLPLLKADLARIVSKWVGETEKNLETVFSEAEDGNCVVFFDECDALFGKRGEVQHGVDRYANLEVSYLLQRLESFAGLVILASNLRDQIDAAFTRRFQIAVHFPRPALAERRRIWEIAFPASAPRDADVDLEALARLDLTGAGIVGIAHTAALLAADAGCPRITMAHVIRATARQFRREARLLTPADLGQYATLLQGAS